MTSQTSQPRRASALLLAVAGWLWPIVLVVAAGLGVGVHACLGAVEPTMLALATLTTLAAWGVAVTLTSCAGGYPERARRVALCFAPLVFLSIEALRQGSGSLTAPYRAPPCMAVAGLLLTNGYIWLGPLLQRRSARLRAAIVAPAVIWLVALAWGTAEFALDYRQWQEAGQRTQDMAIYEQAAYSSLHGQFLSYTTDLRYPGIPIHRWGDHFEPLFLVFVPLYALWGSPVWFLAAQAFMVALGAIPVARLASRWCQSRFAGLTFAVAYLLAPEFHEALRSEFHLEVLAVPLLLWGFELLERRRVTGGYIFFVLAMACKENIAATVVMMALYLAWRGRRCDPLPLAALAVVWLVVAFRVIIPHFSPTGAYLYTDMLRDPQRQALLAGHWGHAGYFFGKRLDYTLFLTASVADLCFLAPAALAIAAPQLVVAMLAAKPTLTILSGHYHATVMVGIVVAGVAGLERLLARLRRYAAHRAMDGQRLTRAAMLGFAGACLAFAWQTMTALNSFSLTSLGPLDGQTRELLRALATVPDGVPAAAETAGLASHLARRTSLTLLSDVPATSALPDVTYLALEGGTTLVALRLLDEQHWSLVASADRCRVYVRSP